MVVAQTRGREQRSFRSVLHSSGNRLAWVRKLLGCPRATRCREPVEQMGLNLGLNSALLASCFKLASASLPTVRVFNRLCSRTTRPQRSSDSGFISKQQEPKSRLLISVSAHNYVQNLVLSAGSNFTVACLHVDPCISFTVGTSYIGTNLSF